MCYNNSGDGMRGRKFKKLPLIILGIIILIGIIIGVIFLVKTINYHKTYEYKLLKHGYVKNDLNKIEKLDNTSKDYLLSIDYNKDIIKIINEKYFLENNLKKYIEYNKNNDKSFSDVIAIVNVGADKEFYKDPKKTDISKGILMLTNKFNYLDNTYNSDKMFVVSKQYSYGENQMLTSETYNEFIKMFKAAKEAGLKLIINSSFRSYEDQEEIYNMYKNSKGEEYADAIAAKPGFSEHQTGMAIDIQAPGSRAATFEEFEEFKWLQENAHKYGFILRYPKDKEYLTGYNYESWHYRYVGVEVATYIKENNITFDEYYAYYLD